MNRGKPRKRRLDPTTPRWVCGVGPVSELIAARPESAIKVWLAEGRLADSERDGREDPAARIARWATSAGIEVAQASMEKLDELVQWPGPHQGVVAMAQPYTYARPLDILRTANDADERPLIVALDGVTDPHNLGAIARSALLLGAHGLIVPKDRAAAVNATSTKASAGAVEQLLIAQVTNLARTLKDLKDENLWIYAVDAGEDAYELSSVDWSGPVCLVLGSEGAGVRPLVKKGCDLSVAIPMRTDAVGSFNVSVAAALTLYEVDRQRRSA